MSKNLDTYQSYFKSIAYKIKQNIVKYSDRCFKTAHTMFVYFLRRYQKPHSKLIIKTKSDLNQLFDIIKSRTDLLMVLEFHAQTVQEFDSDQRLELANKYNIQIIPKTFASFAFKRSHIRFITHAINILIEGDKIILAQSWDGIQPYHLYGSSKITSKKSLEFWLDQLFHSLETGPVNFFEQFDSDLVYNQYVRSVILPNNEKIVRMIVDERFKWEFDMEAYCMFLD
jgi:hypothetical protein